MKGLRLQPILDLYNGRTVGYEVLSDFAHPTHCESWFYHQSPRRLIDLRRWQLQQLVATPWDGTLFLNLPLAALCLPDITLMLAGESVHTAIELQDPEMLRDLDDERLAALRRGLVSLSNAGFPLWLDDYRPCYDAVLDRLDWQFDGVKIDRQEFYRYRNAPDAVATLIAQTRRYGTIILVEGIETAADLARGFFWPEIHIPAAA